MKFTLSWLKDYLDTNASVEQIGEKLTAIGLEVEEIIDNAARYAPFIIAEILEAKPHPDATKLQVCRVNNGKEELQIVCGAPNARAGIKVVLAPIGAVIPANGLVIKASNIRGVSSNGMLCSAAELDLGEDSAGIIELPQDAVPGTSFVSYKGLDDPVFDIAITPNRGDCLGVYGVARDLAAAGLGTLKPRNTTKQTAGFTSPLKVTIEDTQGCPYFVIRHFRNLKNGQSPEWLQRRLKAIGLNPISALVDITNYVLFDLGRPLHVYDAKKIKGNMVVKPAKGGEVFAALNDKEYTLSEGVITIADDANVQGLGGVMGGKQSACESDTTEVYLEIALFDPISVANTGRKLGIISDSRYRFERNVDPSFILDGAEIATKLILELCGGEASEMVIAGKEPAWQRSITFPVTRVETLGGVKLSEQEIKNILTALGFGVSGSGNVLEVTVPAWRSDVEGVADLVEEVVRINGYDRIPFTSLPKLTDALPIRTAKQKAVVKARHELAARGLTEVVTWSFMDSAKAALFTPVKEELRLLNPISSDLDAMRPSILPNLLDAATRNANRSIADTALFEVGSAYRDATPGKGQDVMVAGIRTGNNAAKNIYKDDRKVDCFDAKADILAALAALGAPESVQIVAEAPHWYHPGRSGAVKLGKAVLGYFGELHPVLVQKFDVENTVVGFEIFVDALPAQKPKKTTAKPKLELSAYQPVTRDFAFLVAKEEKAENIMRAVRKAEKQLIEEVRIFDVYAGKGIEEGKKSVAISITLQPKDKTLTDAEIEAVATNVVNAVQKEVGGTLRS